MLKEITIEYIYHSGFSVKFEDQNFIFDYYKGKLPSFKSPTAFFVSHSHDDHYNPEIFNLKGDTPYKYILSSDIKSYEKKENIIDLGSSENVENLKHMYSENSYHIKEGDNLILDNFSVRAFPSTDKGVSFLVNYHGINIFHAGDLNLWVWDEDTPEEKEQMYERFISIIKEISIYDIDIAFFPLDPRLGQRYADGFNMFIDEVEPSIILPMHFKDDVSYNLQYMTQFKEYSDIYRPIFKNNQFFLVNYEG